ncbi:MAG: metal-dependent hydrolase [Candidatus Zixiibacteriota bacterium]
MPTARFLGHACVTVSDGTHNFIIDPFLNGNPLAAAKPENIKCDYIILTHGHDDHFGDTVIIAKNNNAKVIANFELAMFCAKQGLDVHDMGIGGSRQFEFGRVKFTIAHHGSGYGQYADIYTGSPAGVLLTLAGKTLYHSGDTALFYDMKLIGEMNQIDIAFLPIGDNYTMGVDDAAKAVEFLSPKIVVPIHYNTFPIINQDPLDFARKVKSAKVIILKPGESVDY